jgi:hypothetical protein
MDKKSEGALEVVEAYVLRILSKVDYALAISMLFAGCVAFSAQLYLNFTRYDDESHRVHEDWKLPLESFDFTSFPVYCTIICFPALIFTFELQQVPWGGNTKSIVSWFVKTGPAYLFFMFMVLSFTDEVPIFFMNGDPFRLLAVHWAINETRTNDTVGTIALLIASSDRLYYGIGAPICWLVFMFRRIITKTAEHADTPHVALTLVCLVCTTRVGQLVLGNSSVTRCGVMIQDPIEGKLLSFFLLLLSVFVLVVLLRPKGKKAFIKEVNDEEEGKEIKEIDTSLVLNRRGDKRRKRLFFRVEGGK